MAPKKRKAVGDANKPPKKAKTDLTPSDKQLTLDLFTTAPIKVVSEHEMLDAMNDKSLREKKSPHMFFKLPASLIPEGPPNDMNTEKTASLEFVIMIRSISFKRIDQLSEWSGLPAITDKGYIILGPAGVGKSTLLLHVVAYCRLTNWLVVYIPQASSFENEQNVPMQCLNFLLQMLDSEKTVDLLKQVEVVDDTLEFLTLPATLHELVRAGSRSQKHAENAAIAFIQQLTILDKFPVLLAIDQWNAMLKAKSKFCALFHNFSTIQMKRGVCFFAISSSCNPVPYMKDGDYGINTFQVKPYSPEEFNDAIQYAISENQIPDVIAKLSIMKQIQEQTGNLPRMVKWLVHAWKGKLNDDISKLLPTYKSMTIQYFEERVKKVLERSSELDKMKCYSFAAKIYLNEELKEGDMTQLWRISGLVFQNNDEYIVSCPPARSAIIQVLNSECLSVIKILASYQETIWKALELHVVSKFYDPNGLVAIPFRNLLGVIDKSKPSLNLQASRVIVQQRPCDATYEIRTINLGDMIVCHINHPVIDYVMYSKSGQLFFIQVSMSSYADHSTKVKDLVQHELKVKKDRTTTFKTMSVLNYYLKCAGKSVHDSRVTTKLPEGVFYLYITLRGGCGEKSQYAKDPVVLVNDDESLSNFGEAWGFIKESKAKFSI